MAVGNEIVRVALHYTQPGAGDCMNVFHFQLDGVVGDDESVFASIVEWAISVWGNQWKNFAAGAASLASMEADVMNLDGTVDRNLGGYVIDIDGIVFSSVLPAGVSCYLLAYTPIPKARGSKYVPGVSENGVENGVLTTAAQVVLAALMAIYVNDYTAINELVLTPGLLSKVLGVFVHFNATGAFDTLPAYQRRRKVGVGI